MAAAEGIADMLSLRSKIDSTLQELTNPQHFIPNKKYSHKCSGKNNKQRGRRKLGSENVDIADKLLEAKCILGESPVSTLEYPTLGSLIQSFLMLPS